MTGNAVENILAYALSCYFGRKAKSQQNEIDPKNKKLASLFRKNQWTRLQEEKEILMFIEQSCQKMKKDYQRYIEEKKNGNKIQGKLENKMKMEVENKQKPQYLQNPLIIAAKKLTLKEYYELTGVQFTCTSVDLVDKLQRFFNHKTTPRLPVCKAVQMTGSFPVAFQSLSWKQQWGKYYIHYYKTRRQIDLTGHNFTDGGLLANFPLKFLDNEKFREKYFSHTSVKEKTFLYGFDLDKLQDFPQNNDNKLLQHKKNILLNEIKYKILFKILFSLMNKSSKDIKTLMNSKLINFLMSLGDALRQSDRNLNIQCFKHQIVKKIFEEEIVKGIKTYNPDKKQKSIKKNLQKVIAQIQRQYEREINVNILDEETYVKKFFYDQLSEIYQNFQARGTKSQRLTWNDIQTIQFKIQSNLLNLSQKCAIFYQNKVVDLKQQFRNSNPFVTSLTDHHQKNIKMLLNGLFQNFQKQQKGNIFGKIDTNYKEFLREFKKYWQYIALNIEDFIQQQRLLRAGHEPKKISSLQQKLCIRHSIIINLIHAKYKLTPRLFAFVQRIQKEYLKKPFPTLAYEIEEEFFLKKIQIKLKIASQIRIEKQKGEYFEGNQKRSKKQLHIILQAKYFSHYYYASYFKLIEECITNKDLKIGIISCTDFHAIFGVFYVMGLDMGRTNQNLAKIHSLFKINKQQNAKEYASKQWMKSTILQIKDLMKNEWQKRTNSFDPFEYSKQMNQQRCLLNNQTKLAKSYQIREDSLESQQQDIARAYQTVINYIAASYHQIAKLPQKQRSKRFDQLLNFNKNSSKIQRTSTRGKRILERILGHTFELMMIAAEAIAKSQDSFLFENSDISREDIFKGMILKSLVSALEYKNYIMKFLEDQGYDPRIPLEKFYNLCEKKIILNFNCVNTTQQRFSLINKCTRPNMPLWAALLACASLPYFENDFPSQKQWELKDRPTLIQKAEMIFTNREAEGGVRGNYYISGNFISSLPLQFMTNRRLKKSKFPENEKYVEIAFSFEKKFQNKQECLQTLESQKEVNLSQQNNDQQSNLQTKLIKKKQNSGIQKNPIGTNPYLQKIARQLQEKQKFLNCGDLWGYICEFLLCCYCCCSADNMGYLKGLAKRLNILKMLNVRINSHDNMILHLYYDNLIKLPIRIDTLDFHKIKQEKPTTLYDTIRQAEYVVRQLFDNIQIQKNKKLQLQLNVYQRNDDSKTTIQFQFHPKQAIQKQLLQQQRYKGIPEQLKEQILKDKFKEAFYRIKFISYTKWRRFTQRYVIHYAFNNEHPQKIVWNMVKEDYVDINKRDIDKKYQLLLQYTFLTNDQIKKNKFLLNLKPLESLGKQPERSILRFEYRKIGFYTPDMHSFQQKKNEKTKRFLGTAKIRSIQIPDQQEYCCNPDCKVSKLTRLFIDEDQKDKDKCKLCQLRYQRKHGNKQTYDKKKIIGMICTQCKAKYCLKCKISHFIKRINNKKEDNFKLVRPHTQKQKKEGKAEMIYKKGYAPVIQSFSDSLENKAKNTCHYCQNYSYVLYSQEQIGKKKMKSQFCGLNICEGCSHFCT